MSTMQNDVFVMGASVLTLGVLGASVFPTKVIPPAGCVGMEFKLLGAAGSTVQILPNAITGATIAGATAITTIGGYPLITGEMYPIPGPSAFYIAATGATATVAFNFYFSSAAAGITAMLV